jgi:hypothetical protein
MGYGLVEVMDDLIYPIIGSVKAPGVNHTFQGELSLIFQQVPITGIL